MNNTDFTSNMKVELPFKNTKEDGNICEPIEELITGVERLGRNSTDENCIPVDSRCMNDVSSNADSATVSSADGSYCLRARKGCIQGRKYKGKPYCKVPGDERGNASRASYINDLRDAERVESNKEMESVIKYLQYCRRHCPEMRNIDVFRNALKETVLIANRRLDDVFHNLEQIHNNVLESTLTDNVTECTKNEDKVLQSKSAKTAS